MYMGDVFSKIYKMHLLRIVDRFLRADRMDLEEEIKDIILRNIDELQNKERIIKKLDVSDESRDVALLNEMILMSLMKQQGYISTENYLYEIVESLEKEILEQSEDETYLDKAMPTESRRIFNAVIDAAWKKDDMLNAHEMNILNVLRTELKLSKHSQYLLECKIGRFPRKGNKLHTTQQIGKSLIKLQSRGLILRFREDTSYYIIQKEIERTLRNVMRIELRNEVYTSLLEDLNNGQLKNILDYIEASVSGRKNELIERIISHDILPSTALNVLGSAELTNVLRNLEGARISGTKENKIQNIIDFYEKLSTPSLSDPTDERSRLYDFYEELASRDYKSLRVNKIINKDVEVENHFEEATRYLFEKKLNVPLLNM